MRHIIVVLLVACTVALTGCNALRDEWSDKQGGPDVDAQVQAAVEDVLPAAESVTVGSRKDGFSQVVNVGITLPDEEYDAADLTATVAAICDTVANTDDVFVEVTDGRSGEAITLTDLVADTLPALDTPYDPTEVHIEVEDDCVAPG